MRRGGGGDPDDSEQRKKRTHQLTAGHPSENRKREQIISKYRE